MKSLIVCVLLCAFFSHKVQSQLKVELELMSGVNLSGSQFDYADDTYEFELKNGFAYGLGLEFLLKNNVSVSAGYLFSQSYGRATLKLPSGFRFSSTTNTIGVMKDRMFCLDIKKTAALKRFLFIKPFVGLFYNPFYFDSEDYQVEQELTQDGNIYVEKSYYYNRINRADKDNSSSNLSFGAFGARVGVGLEKEIRKIGKFSLNVAYNYDFAESANHITAVNIDYIVEDDQTGNLIKSKSYINMDETVKNRNIFSVIVGFKMPCPMIFGGGRKNISTKDLYEKARIIPAE